MAAERATRSGASDTMDWAAARSAIRAEACFHMARTFHAQGDHSSALQWYTQSSKEKPDYAMPLFGLGQMHLVNNDELRRVVNSGQEGLPGKILQNDRYKDRQKVWPDLLGKFLRLE